MDNLLPHPTLGGRVRDETFMQTFRNICATLLVIFASSVLLYGKAEARVDGTDKEKSDTLSVERVEVVGRRNAAQLGTIMRVDSITLSASLGNSVAEQLRLATPVLVRDYGRGQSQNISFRGTSTSHTSLYWNSIKMNSPVAGNVDFSLFGASGVDHLSVAPGVSAISYGDGALGGVVDMQSRPKWNTPFEAVVESGVGSFSSYNLFGAVRVGSNTFQSSTKVSYDYSLNDFEFINRDIIDPSRPGYRPTQKNLGASYHNLTLSQDFFMRLGHTNFLSVSLLAIDNLRNLPQLTTYEGPQNAHLTQSKDKGLYGVVNYKSYNQTVDYEAQMGGTIQDNKFNQNNITSAGNYEPYIDSKSLGNNLQGNFTARFKRLGAHTLELRATGEMEYAASSESVRATGFDKSRGKFSTSADWSALWSQQFSTSVIARGGMVGTQWFGTAAASLDYQNSKNLNFSLRGSYNEHFGSLSDLYYSPGGNPDLKPEKGFTLELGGQYQNSSLRATVNLYGSLIDDWIIWLPTFAQYWSPTNLKQVLSLGMEAQLSYAKQLGKSWTIDASATATLSRTVSVGEPISANDFSKWQQLPFVPLFGGAVQVRARWENLSLSYGVRGESVKYSATNSQHSLLSTIEPYAIHTLRFTYSPWGFMQATVECDNLFNGQYYGILRRPMAPRSYGLSLRFLLQ